MESGGQQEITPLFKFSAYAGKIRVFSFFFPSSSVIKYFLVRVGMGVAYFCTFHFTGVSHFFKTGLKYLMSKNLLCSVGIFYFLGCDEE